MSVHQRMCHDSNKCTSLLCFKSWLWKEISGFIHGKELMFTFELWMKICYAFVIYMNELLRYLSKYLFTSFCGIIITIILIITLEIKARYSIDVNSLNVLTFYLINNSNTFAKNVQCTLKMQSAKFEVQTVISVKN